MDFEYISSDEEEIYMRTKADGEEISDIGDLRSELDRFQQEAIVKEALKNDVDLSVYGEQIEKELSEYSNTSIRDYISESKNLAHLHLEVEECSSILKEMESILVKYQYDLDHAVEEIQTLQSESDRISIRAKNRKDVDMGIRKVVSQLILRPSMVNSLISGEMNEEFFTNLNEFSEHLDFVECIGVDDNELLRRSGIKAIEEIRMDMNILSLHCGNRIRDSMFRKLSEIRKDSNIEMFQKEVLLKMKDGMTFLQRHLKNYYDEVARRYSDVMKNVIFQIFSEYCTQMKKRWIELAPHEELIVMTSTKPSMMKKKTRFSSEDVFVLGDRHSIIDFASSSPLLPSILSSDNEYITFPELFRSLQCHLVECALGEFQFEVLFFNPEDTSLFIDIFNAACEVIHQTTVQWVRSTYDVIGVMLLCILLQSAVEQLAKEGTPILQEFFSNLKAKAIFRLKELLGMQIKNVKGIPVQPRNLNVTNEVHSSIKRYANLSCGVYVLGLSYDMYMDKQVWLEPMNNLALEMVNLIMKLASCVKENKRPSYILNSCLYVADVYEVRHITIDNDFMRLYHDRLHLYIEEMMAKYFSSVVGIVDKYSERSANTAFTSIEGKNIQKYATGWKEVIHTVSDRIQQDFQYRRISVFSMFANELTTYHSKYVQLLQGTPYAKDAPPVQTLVNELMKYRSEYEKVPLNTHEIVTDDYNCLLTNMT